METKTVSHALAPPTRFKSYYVVWKLSRERRWDIVYALFKSYYVVWKLSFTTSIFSFSVVFKSYYVVWKLQAISAAIQSHERV